MTNNDKIRKALLDFLPDKADTIKYVMDVLIDGVHPYTAIVLVEKVLGEQLSSNELIDVIDRYSKL